MQSEDNPTALRFALDDQGQLLVVGAQADPLRVALRPCFPWSDPERYLSLRDTENEEVAFVEDPSTLDGGSRVALEKALEIARLTIDITAITGVSEHFQIVLFEVDTNRGPRKFQIKYDDFPHKMPDGSVVFKDLAGDLYRVAEPDALDERSAKLVYS